jgi:hypothetical protein
MELFSEAHSYATRERAIKQLDTALAKIERSRGNVRWFVTITAAGRFVPVVSLGSDHVLRINMLGLVGEHVSVIN